MRDLLQIGSLERLIVLGFVISLRVDLLIPMHAGAAICFRLSLSTQ